MSVRFVKRIFTENRYGSVQYSFYVFMIHNINKYYVSEKVLDICNKEQAHTALKKIVFK